MCGRYTLSKPGQVLAEALEIEEAEARVLCTDLGLEPRYNVAPTQAMPIVWTGPAGTRERPERCAEMAQWGLQPRRGTAAGESAPLGGRSSINARAETIAQLPSFAEAFRQRRCLVPADGFYEWRRVGKSKQPYYFSPQRGSALCFAGLFNEPGNGSALSTYCLVTKAASGCVSEVHGRMPVMLDAQWRSVWIDRDSDPGQLGELLECANGSSDLESFPVGNFVNRVADDAPHLIERVEPLPENLPLF